MEKTKKIDVDKLFDMEKGETMIEKPERDSVKLKLQGYMDKAKEQDGKDIIRNKNRGMEEL